jgi:hypothetical protein
LSPWTETPSSSKSKGSSLASARGAAPVAGGGGACELSLSRVAAEAALEGSSIGSIRVATIGENEKP